MNKPAITILRKLREEDYKEFEDRANDTLKKLGKKAKVMSVEPLLVENLFTLVITYERTKARSLEPSRGASGNDNKEERGRA